MRLPFVSPRDYFIEPLRPDDSAAIADVHAEDFARPWSDDEFAALMDQDTVFGFAARQVGRPGQPLAGFVLARLAAGEAEILTVAVARAHRRMGLGRALMDAVLRELDLYRRLGFEQVGRRPGYYEHGSAPRTGALVMKRDLR